jgi:hypothetical protein
MTLAGPEHRPPEVRHGTAKTAVLVSSSAAIDLFTGNRVLAEGNNSVTEL